MLYLFYGQDFRKARSAMRECIEALRAKKPNIPLRELHEETYERTECEDFLVSQGLFEANCIVSGVRFISNNKEAEEWCVENIERLEKSPNIFVFYEETLLAKTYALLKKHAHTVREFPLRSVKKGPQFNVFGLADALGQRNKKNAWIVLQRAYMKGESPEKLHGMLFWQVKVLFLVKDAMESGQDTDSLRLKPFVLKKATALCRNYTKEELKKLSSKLVSVYHEARQGGAPLDIAIERLILSL